MSASSEMFTSSTSKESVGFCLPIENCSASAESCPNEKNKKYVASKSTENVVHIINNHSKAFTILIKKESEYIKLHNT